MPSHTLHTFSIVAYDPATNAWGAAVASKFLAAGALVIWARAGAGAVATQAFAKVSFGPDALDRMAAGVSANEVIARLAGDDPLRERRQVACVDAQGRAAAFTGSDCFDWKGHRTGPGYTCQGNILTGPETLDTMAHAFESTRDDFAGRLVAALHAADRVGGDRRGKQSAAVLVVTPGGGYGGDNDRAIDLRVDDHPDPVARLAELLDLHRLYFGKAAPEDLIPIDATLAAELQGVLVRLGYLSGPSTGAWDASTIDAFWRFVGTENLEERWTPEDAHRLDPVVLNFIREHFPA